MKFARLLILALYVLCLAQPLSCAPVSDAPELLHRFFKRLTETSLRGNHLSLTTPRITTSWGTCTITDTSITIIMDGQKVVWEVPGGPWTINYHRETDTIELTPRKEQDAATKAPEKFPEFSPPHHNASTQNQSTHKEQPATASSSNQPQHHTADQQQDAITAKDALIRYCSDYIRNNAETLTQKKLCDFLKYVRKIAVQYHVEWLELLRSIHTEIDPCLETLQTTRDPKLLQQAYVSLALSPLAAAATYAAYHYKIQVWDKQTGEQDRFIVPFLAGVMTAGALACAVEGFYGYYKPETTNRYRFFQQLRDLLRA